MSCKINPLRFLGAATVLVASLLGVKCARDYTAHSEVIPSYRKLSKELQLDDKNKDSRISVVEAFQKYERDTRSVRGSEPRTVDANFDFIISKEEIKPVIEWYKEKVFNDKNTEQDKQVYLYILNNLYRRIKGHDSFPAMLPDKLSKYDNNLNGAIEPNNEAIDLYEGEHYHRKLKRDSGGLISESAMDSIIREFETESSVLLDFEPFTGNIYKKIASDLIVEQKRINSQKYVKK